MPGQAMRNKERRYEKTQEYWGRGRKAMCLFEASDAELVKEVTQTAQIPFTRAVEALDLTPQ